ncbi:hypothetical protein AZ66_05790 [Paenibacillus sp. E194]|nr:hypothetical protein AZ66_05790 [Paenibacillus sp. E194]
MLLQGMIVEVHLNTLILLRNQNQERRSSWGHSNLLLIPVHVNCFYMITNAREKGRVGFLATSG